MSNIESDHTQSGIATLYAHSLPAGLRNLIDNNRDILNHVLSGELRKEGPYSLTKLRIDFDDRVEAIRELEIEGLIGRSKEAGNVVLTFAGFLFCDSPVAKEFHTIAHKLYAALRETYKRTEGKKEESVQDLVKRVYAPPHDLDDRYQAVNKILDYFSTAPDYIVSLNRSAMHPNPTSNIPIVRGGDQIIDSENLGTLISKSCKKFATAYNERHSQALPETYSIKEEVFVWEGSFKDQKEFKCFVIMPIGDKETIDYKNNMIVYEQIIKRAVDNCGYKIICHHADDELFTKSGDISKQIFESLRDEDIVIADLRRRNVNVIYELGIRHALGKRSILVCSDYSENFFHNQHYRSIKYEITGKSNQEFYGRMKNAIEDIIKNPDKPDNPVVDSLGKVSINEDQGHRSKASDFDVIINEDSKQLGSTGGGGGYRGIQCALSFRIRNRGQINVCLEDVEIKNEILGVGVIDKHNPNFSRLPFNVDSRKTEEYILLFKFPNGTEGNMKGKELKILADFEFSDVVINKEIIRHL